MKIRKMQATFGKLKNASLELEPGMNVITAPNEYGKSTWCAFIKAMLYGVDTSERDRAGYLAAKTRYRPWDGSAMAGTMELTHRGEAITLQRTGGATTPFKNLLAVRTGTADFVRTLTPASAGEILTGVSERVFERTAFIRRPDLRVSQTADLEKRISALVFTGESEVSFTEAEEELRAWQRKLRYNKTGLIPTAEEELKKARSAMEEIEKSAGEAASLESTIQRLTQQTENLERDLETHKRLERRAAARRILETRRQRELAEEETARLTASVTRGGHQMTRQDVALIRETASSITPLRKVRAEAEKALRQAEREKSELEAKRAASPLSELSETEAGELSRRAMDLRYAAEKAKKRRIPRALPILLLVLGALMCLAFSGALVPFGAFVPRILPWVRLRWKLLGPGLGLVALGVFLLVWKPRPPAAQRELEALLEKYGVPSTDRLSSMAAAYAAVCRGLEPAETMRDAARKNYENAAAEADRAESTALEEISRFLPQVQSGREIAQALNETEERLGELERAQYRLTALRERETALLEEYGGEPEVDDEYIREPLRDREDTENALMRARAQLTEATRAYDTLTGARRSLGDPAVVSGRVRALREEIGENELKYQALAAAHDALTQANTELTTRFSPLISKKAGAYMERLTDGKYEKLNFDRGFDVNAERAGDVAARNVLSLSDGTTDEIYFSLRLAMCELILGGEDPCPIILDDALVNFDDERCLEALDLLAALADTRQVILFSCHSREARLLEGRGEVNLIQG